MSETTERVGQYDVSVAFCAPAKDEDHRQRRVEALAAWLLAQWEAQRKENEHGDAHAAG
jgi:hypothetical protein